MLSTKQGKEKEKMQINYDVESFMAQEIDWQKYYKNTMKPVYKTIQAYIIAKMSSIRSPQIKEKQDTDEQTETFNIEYQTDDKISNC